MAEFRALSPDLKSKRPQPSEPMEARFRRRKLQGKGKILSEFSTPIAPFHGDGQFSRHARVLAKIERAERHAAEKLARRESSSGRPAAAFSAACGASSRHSGRAVPADPFLARGGRRGPELALSLRQWQQVQEVLRKVIPGAIRP